MKKQDNKDKLKESFSIFQKQQPAKESEEPKEKKITAESSTTKNKVEEPVKKAEKKKPASNLKDLFGGDENKGYSAVQVKKLYLEKVEELAKEHKTTKTRVVNIIIENFLKENGII
ncbi:hypothetical protein [Chondrinema litorale]|uniref:hypothetical protein n=1 Tax=Chondrinema litorale TaxID=2994555 RepID=UPI002543E0E8|nr:hypothetical protein [Chondrinema litorale]UZR99180.1 hypothetical protein OQ292_34805 [Chondrinema litorale]